MRQLDEFFEIQVDKLKMKATLVQNVKLNEELNITVDTFKNFVREHGIVFGVKEDLFHKIISNEISCPVIIAEGDEPNSGKDAYLKPVFPDDNKVENKDELRKVDLKQVINIPSVTHGQLIGEKIQATLGKPGKNIFGETVPSKPGKDFKLRTGKNTRICENGLKIFATTDGQMSVEAKVIHVYPVFEVNGDLDMKIGNINFIGSVNIRGNVPAGFEIKCNGDLKVHGTVESAILIAEGSIFVSAGIVGQGKGLIKAKGDLYTSFINQGNVDVEGDVNVVQSILHSKVQAGGSVYCNKGKGNIVGGNVSSTKMIIAKEVGNSHNTKTSLYLGVNHEIMKKEKLYSENFTKADEDLKKLQILLNNFNQKEKLATISTKEKIMRLRVRNTINQVNEMMLEAKEKLGDLQAVFSDFEHSSAVIQHKVYPNVDISFGKYRRKIVTSHQAVKIRLNNGEIIIEPI